MIELIAVPILRSEFTILIQYLYCWVRFTAGSLGQTFSARGRPTPSKSMNSKRRMVFMSSPLPRSGYRGARLLFTFLSDVLTKKPGDRTLGK